MKKRLSISCDMSVFLFFVLRAMLTNNQQNKPSSRAAHYSPITTLRRAPLRHPPYSHTCSQPRPLSATPALSHTCSHSHPFSATPTVSHARSHSRPLSATPTLSDARSHSNPLSATPTLSYAHSQPRLISATPTLSYAHSQLRPLSATPAISQITLSHAQSQPHAHPLSHCCTAESSLSSLFCL